MKQLIIAIVIAVSLVTPSFANNVSDTVVENAIQKVIQKKSADKRVEFIRKIEEVLPVYQNNLYWQRKDNKNIERKYQLAKKYGLLYKR